MKKILLISVVLSLAATDSIAQRQGFQRFGRRFGADSSVKLEHFTFKRVSFAAPSLESVEASFGLYLPKGYDNAANKDKHYPWAVWLHGMNGDYRRFHFGGAKVLDRLRGEGKIPEMIFVALSGPSRTLYLNGERSGDVEDLILWDLKDYLEAEYRVSRRRRDRAIMGVSIGGYGAIKIALEHPGIFGTVAAHSSALLPADPGQLSDRYQRYGRFMGLGEALGDPVDPKKWAKVMPMAMAAHIQPSQLKGLRIWFDAGSEDNYGFGPANVAFDKVLAKQQIPHEFTLVEGAGHAWHSDRNGFGKRLARSLEFVGSRFGKAPVTTSRPSKRG